MKTARKKSLCCVSVLLLTRLIKVFFVAVVARCTIWLLETHTSKRIIHSFDVFNKHEHTKEKRTLIFRTEHDDASKLQGKLLRRTYQHLYHPHRHIIMDFYGFRFINSFLFVCKCVLYVVWLVRNGKIMRIRCAYVYAMTNARKCQLAK